MKWDVTKQVLAALVRYLLFAFGSWLVKKGIIDQQMADAWLTEASAIVAGTALLAIPLLWKVLNARFHFLALIKAVQTDPPADSPQEIKSAIQDVKAQVKADAPMTTSL